MRARGIDPDAHFARQLTRELAESAGLIVVAEAEHRDWLIDEWPDLIDRIALLREAAAVAVDDPELLASAADPSAPLPARLVGACRHDPAWGVDDPFRRGPEAADRAVGEVAAALDALLPWYAARLDG